MTWVETLLRACALRRRWLFYRRRPVAPFVLMAATLVLVIVILMFGAEIATDLL